jgi:hypothetical protein
MPTTLSSVIALFFLLPLCSQTDPGVGVQVLPQGGHFAVKQIDEMWDLHIGRIRLG